MKILNVSVYLLVFLMCVLSYTKFSQKWSINVISRSFPWKISMKGTFLFRGLFLVYHVIRSIFPMAVTSTAHTVLETVLPTHYSWVYSIVQHCVWRILTVNLFRSSGSRIFPGLFCFQLVIAEFTIGKLADISCVHPIPRPGFQKAVSVGLLSCADLAFLV